MYASFTPDGSVTMFEDMTYWAISVADSVNNEENDTSTTFINDLLIGADGRVTKDEVYGLICIGLMFGIELMLQSWEGKEN